MNFIRAIEHIPCFADERIAVLISPIIDRPVFVDVEFVGKGGIDAIEGLTKIAFAGFVLADGRCVAVPASMGALCLQRRYSVS